MLKIPAEHEHGEEWSCGPAYPRPSARRGGVRWGVGGGPEGSRDGNRGGPEGEPGGRDAAAGQQATEKSAKAKSYAIILLTSLTS